MKFFVSNPYQAKGKKNAVDIREYNLKQKLVDKYTPKSYSAKWLGAFRASLAFSYLFNFYSLITGIFAIAMLIYNIIFNNIGSNTAIIISVSAGVIVAFLLELIKRAANSVGFSTFFVSQNDSEVKSDILINGLVITGLSVVSIGLSGIASFMIPQTSNPPPTLFQIEGEMYNQEYYNKNASYDSQINDLINERNHIKSSRKWKGRISNSDQKEVTKLNNKITELRDKKRLFNESKEIEINDTYQELVKQHKIKNSNTNWWLLYATIITEILFIICMYYKERYLWKSLCERIDVFVSSNGTTLSVNGDRRQGIGFFSDAKNTENVNDNNRNIVLDGERIKPCENCGEMMEYKNSNKRFCSDTCRWEAWSKNKNN